MISLDSGGRVRGLADGVTPAELREAAEALDWLDAELVERVRAEVKAQVSDEALAERITQITLQQLREARRAPSFEPLAAFGPDFDKDAGIWKKSIAGILGEMKRLRGASAARDFLDEISRFVKELAARL